MPLVLASLPRVSYSSEIPKNEAWIVSVDMGYGHQRAAYPFRDIAFERIITANTDACVSAKERALWARFQALPEGISRAKIFPLLARGYGALTIASNRSALTTLSVICRSHRLAPLVFIVSSVVALVPAWLRAHVNARTCRFSLRFTRWHWPPITRGAATSSAL